MRKLNFPNFAGLDPVQIKFFSQIAQASQEADVVDIGGAFTITGSYTATRNLNVTTPTLANIAAVLATLISDLQHGGAQKTN